MSEKYVWMLLVTWCCNERWHVFSSCKKEKHSKNSENLEFGK